MIADMASFCPLCRHHYYDLKHKCPPVWECSLDEKDLYWRKVYVVDQEAAARKYAEEIDSGSDYFILQAGETGETVVLVRPAHEKTATPQKFRVYGESVPQYYAREITSRVAGNAD